MAISYQEERRTKRRNWMRRTFDYQRALFRGGAGVGLLLDGLSMGAVYSLRKLVSAFAGNCVRIRRSSDNSEQDFGFVDNVVDTAGITTFIGGGNGFIATWYDQSGNGFDQPQAVANSQPAFIASGINSLPSARYDGTDDLLMRTSVSSSALFNADECTIMFVKTADGTHSTHRTLTAPGAVNIYAPYLDNNIYFDFGSAGAAGRVSVAQPSGFDDVPHVHEFYRTTAGVQGIVIDGATLASPGSHTDNRTSVTTDFYLGASATERIKGDMSEFIILKGDIGSAARAAIRANQGAYYGITVA